MSGLKAQGLRMLSFVDQVTSIKVFRVHHDDDGHVVRQRLGLVRKKDFSLDDELAALSNDEKSSINSMIDFYTKAADYETIAALYSMPQALRKSVEYATTKGSKMERDMLLMSIVEALRMMRKAEKSEAENDGT